MKTHGWMSVIGCTLLVGCQLASPMADWEGNPASAAALQSLPPVQQYPTGSPLPVASSTHLVMGNCSTGEGFMAEAVNAQGIILARWVGYDATASARFLKEALGTGLPIAIYTAPMLMESTPTSSRDSGTPDPPIFDPCFIPGIGDPTDDRPTVPDPRDASQWEIFSFLALQTSRALHSVSHPYGPH